MLHNLSIYVCMYLSICLLVDPRPVNLNILAEKVKAGDNASTVLNTELPVFKATPGTHV